MTKKEKSQLREYVHNMYSLIKSARECTDKDTRDYLNALREEVAKIHKLIIEQ